MPMGLLGKKLGMTHVYDSYGRRKAVTAVQLGPCTITGVRRSDRNGYTAIQVGFEPIAEKKLTQPQRGQFKQLGGKAFRYVREFRVSTLRREGTASASKSKEVIQQVAQEPSSAASEETQAVGESDSLSVGEQLGLDMFQDYELVDVTGTSIGKGFQGGMKRWNWSGGPETHGSMSHRAPGAISSGTTPGRVFRGHHLPGHMGDRRVTIQNVRILRRDLENHILLLEGSVPGSEHGLVLVRKSVKKSGVVKVPHAFQVMVEEEAAKTAKPKKK